MPPWNTPNAEAEWPRGKKNGSSMHEPIIINQNTCKWSGRLYV